MFIHMRTTLIIPDQLIRQLKKRAAERGETLSAAVADAIRRGLEPVVPGLAPAPLPTHALGRPMVDIADRNALYDAMEGG